jgi:hypothetical protein
MPTAALMSRYQPPGNEKTHARYPQRRRFMPPGARPEKAASSRIYPANWLLANWWRSRASSYPLDLKVILS